MGQPCSSGMNRRMRSLFPALTLVAFAALAAGPQTEAGPLARITSAYDGDTITLEDGRRIRLLQIDTPELGSGECYSRAARKALVSLAPLGSSVSLEPDARLDRVDRYGRLLRYVWRGSTNVN